MPPTKYTTIQVRVDLANHIRTWCAANDTVISRVTDRMWSDLISSSVAPLKKEKV